MPSQSANVFVSRHEKKVSIKRRIRFREVDVGEFLRARVCREEQELQRSDPL